MPLIPAQLGKILIIAGVFLAVIGALVLFNKNIPIGRLPGDIFIQKENFSFYFPITTTIIISIIFSIVMYFIGKK